RLQDHIFRGRPGLPVVRGVAATARRRPGRLDLPVAAGVRPTRPAGARAVGGLTGRNARKHRGGLAAGGAGGGEGGGVWVTGGRRRPSGYGWAGTGGGG